MPDLRAATAMLTGKALTRGIRATGRGGGTAFPGLVANYLDPNLLDTLAARLPAGTIVVAGTNGKTTTSRMLAAILEGSGRTVAHNRSGSNLVRGISAAFAEQLPLYGTGGAEIGVIESDENAFPEVVRRAQPRVIVLLNLFRDQLDRYGELETIAAHWRTVTRELSTDTVLVVNVDDPNLAALAEETAARVVRFGLEDRGIELSGLPHASDATVCRNCESSLRYEAHFVSHLGKYRCPNCGWSRPDPQVAARDITVEGMERLQLCIDDGRRPHNHGTFGVDAGIGGLYNAYNVLAATTTALTLGVAPCVVQRSLELFVAAFGRLEQVTLAERRLTLALAKNPVGFNELLRMLAMQHELGPVGIGINDRDADGRDVSWLWDVDFEGFVASSGSTPVFAFGIRGYDLAVRLKYGGISVERLNVALADLPGSEVIDELVKATAPGDRITLLLTYTAMLELRQALADRGAVAQFWEQ